MQTHMTLWLTTRKERAEYGICIELGACIHSFAFCLGWLLQKAIKWKTIDALE